MVTISFYMHMYKSAKVIMNRYCPICSCKKNNHIFTQNFNNSVLSLIDRYDISICQDCGFVFADNIPSQSEYNNYYSILSKYEFNDKKNVLPEDYIRYYSKIFSFLSPKLKNQNIRILDIGASTGGLLSVFKKNGYYNLTGVDPSEACSKAASELYNIQVCQNNIFDFQSEVTFDLIILSAVLEHIVDLKRSIEKIKTILNDDGMLFLEVPDVEGFDKFITAPFQQFSVEHINYFTRNSLKNLLVLSGFEIVKMKQGDNKINNSIESDIFILAEKSGNSISHGIKKDESGEKKIYSYIEKCRKLDTDLKNILEKKLSGHDKVIIWGVGTHTQRLIGCGLDTSKILFFVDSNMRYSGKRLEGIEIKAPDEIKNTETPILISTFSYQDEIADQIKKKLKLKNKIITIY